MLVRSYKPHSSPKNVCYLMEQGPFHMIMINYIFVCVMVLLRMFIVCMCVRVHNTYGYGIHLCSFMCKLIQFILMAITFLPLHTRHSNPYIFLHVLHLSYFRAVSQNNRPDLQLTSQSVDHYSVNYQLFPPLE